MDVLIGLRRQGLPLLRGLTLLALAKVPVDGAAPCRHISQQLHRHR
jgi:hypothetical protein